MNTIPKMIIRRNCAMFQVHFEGSNVVLFKSIKRANCKDFIEANEPGLKENQKELSSLEL